jgi:hypothetical protein
MDGTHDLVGLILFSISYGAHLFFRYVALNMLMKAISVDTQAVQRHRATILECVKVTKYNFPSYIYPVCLFLQQSKICTIFQELTHMTLLQDKDCSSPHFIHV